MNTRTAGRIIAILSLAALVAVPLVAAAAAQNATGIPYWAPGGLISCTGNYLDQNNSHPCQSVCDLIQTFANIIYFLITICLFVLAPIFFGIGGIMLMVSGANPEMRSRGRSVLTGTVIGVGIILCAYLIVFTFLGIFNAVSNGQPVFSNNIQCTAQFPASSQ
jgi:hypothetical protein